MVFKDRKEAGRLLAEELGRYRNRKDVLVLGLPRGGVTVAFEIARALGVPLDLLIVRKIGYPSNPELAVGAVSETGAVALNEDVIAYGVTRDYIEKETARQKEEIARRMKLYRGGKGLPSLAGKTVILVDDGIATGATVKAAIATLKKEPIARLVAALPVSSQEAAREISGTVDEWVCLQTPYPFYAVGAFFRDFTQVEDDEVVAMLQESAQEVKPHETD